MNILLSMQELSTKDIWKIFIYKEENGIIMLTITLAMIL